MYKVIKYFTDLLDENRPYEVGDIFPHKDCGYPVGDERLAQLAGSNNKQKTPLIELVKDDAEQEAEQEQSADGEPDAEQEAEKPKRGRKAAGK